MVLRSLVRTPYVAMHVYCLAAGAATTRPSRIGNAAGRYPCRAGLDAVVAFGRGRSLGLRLCGRRVRTGVNPAGGRGVAGPSLCTDLRAPRKSLGVSGAVPRLSKFS